MVKTAPANARDVALIPRSGRSLGQGKGFFNFPLQYFSLGNPMDREPGRLQFMMSQESRLQLSD